MCAHPALSVRTQSPVCAVWPRARGVVTLTLERTPEPGGGLRARVRVGVRAAVPCRVCRCALCGRADARCAVSGAVVSRLAAARALPPSTLQPPSLIQLYGGPQFDLSIERHGRLASVGKGQNRGGNFIENWPLGRS